VTLTLVSYAYVAPKGTPPSMSMRNVTIGVANYLEAHVTKMLGRSASGSLPPAVFRSESARQRFIHLQAGTQQDFLVASQELADRLYRAMDDRSKRGFFVTIRQSNPMHGAALKLDVSDEAAAALRLDTAGQPTLEEIENLLDIPGALQKGAVAPDAGPGSDVAVGDKLYDTSLYFLAALDVEQRAAPGRATSDFLGIIHKVAPSKVAAAAVAVEHESRVSIDDFFSRHADLLTSAEQTEVVQRSRSRPRPIGDIDPESYIVREEIEADGITIRGRAAAIRDKVRITARPGGYRIQIDVDEQPRRQYV
jgi:hypothetical protein